MHGRWVIVLVSTLMLVPLVTGPHVSSPTPEASTPERSACSEEVLPDLPSSHLQTASSAPTGPVPSSEVVDDTEETVDDVVDEVDEAVGCDGLDAPVRR